MLTHRGAYMLTHRGATHRIPLHAHLDVDRSQAMIFGAMARQTLTAAVRLQQQSAEFERWHHFALQHSRFPVVVCLACEQSRSNGALLNIDWSLQTLPGATAKYSQQSYVAPSRSADTGTLT